MKKLNSLLKEKEKLLTKIKSFDDFMMGTVYLSKRKCSNPKCKCHIDERYLHKSFVLSVTREGKTHTLSLRKDEVEGIKRLTQYWKDLRGLIIRLTDINMQIIRLKKQLNKNLDDEAKKDKAPKRK